MLLGKMDSICFAENPLFAVKYAEYNFKFIE